MSTDSQDAVIAVFEREPYWGPELQRQFQHNGSVVRECRSVRDLYPTVADAGAALFVVDLEAGLAECLDWFTTVVNNRSDAIPVIALGSVATAELEWLLREAGVSAFLPDFVTGEELTRLCRRQLRYLDPH